MTSKRILSCILAVALMTGTIPVNMTAVAETTPISLTPSSPTGQLTITLKIKQSITPTVTIADWQYKGTPSTPEVTGNTGEGEVTYEYKVKGADDSTYKNYTTDPPTAQGEYTLRATIAETAEYKGATTTKDFSITPYTTGLTITLKIKETPTVTPPAARTLYANGTEQELVTAGSTTGGTLVYSLDGENYSENIPKAKDVGNYTVYYKVLGNDDFNGTEPQTIPVSIHYQGSLTITLKIKGAITPVLSIADWVYGGTASTPSVTAASNPGNGAVSYEYKVKGADDLTYSSTKPTAAGDYTVRAIVAETDDYKGATATKDFKITKASPTVTAPTANELTYNGTAQELVKAGSAVEGTMQYRLGTDGAWSANIPTAADAGTYEVYYRTTGNGNYKDSDVSATPVTVTIAPAALTITAKDASIVYGEAPKNNGVKAYTLLGTDTLSGELTYTYSYSQYGDVGEYTITPAGLSNPNYDITFAAGKLTVSAKPVTLTWAADTAFTYDGAAHSVTAEIVGLVNDDAVTLTYTNNAKTVAGSYTATAALAGDKAKNYALSDEGKAWSIGKAAITPAVVIEGWTFGDDANAPTVTGNTGNGAVTYTYYQGETALDKAPTDAGTYTVKAAIAETANYKAGEASAEFTIEANSTMVTVSELAEDIQYDGKAHVLLEVPQVPEGVELEYSLNPPHIQEIYKCVEYMETLNELSENTDSDESSYYKNASNALGYFSLSLFRALYNDDEYVESFLKYAQAQVAEMENLPVKSDRTEIAYILKNIKGKTVADIKEAFNSKIEWTTTMPTGTDVGDYYMVCRIKPDSANAKNYTVGSNGVDVLGATIVKADITLAVAIEGWTYGDKANAPTVTGNTGNGAVTYTYYQGDKALEKAPTDAGTYTVKAVIAETANYKAATASKEFTISKAAITPAVEIEDWTFGSKANAPSVTGNIGNGAVTYTYYQGETALDKAPTDAGTYTVKATITETANYKAGVASKDFTISKAAITPEVSITGWTYGEDANAPTVSGNTGNGAVTYTYYQGETALDKAPTDAGTYTVKATITETANYKAGTASKEFTISKAAITPAVSIEGWICGDYDEEENAPTVTGVSEDAAVTFAYFAKGSDKALETVPTEAGAYTVKATVAETANYAGGTASADFIIKADAIVTEVEDLTYDGKAHALVDVSQVPEGVELEYSLNPPLVPEIMKVANHSNTLDDLSENTSGDESSYYSNASDALSYFSLSLFFVLYNDDERAEAFLQLAQESAAEMDALQFKGSGTEITYINENIKGKNVADIKEAFTSKTEWTSAIPTGTDADTYYVTCRIKADSENAKNYSIGLNGIELLAATITKADIKPDVSINDWTYGNKANAPTVTGNTGNGDVTYTYYQGDKALDKAPTDAGTYTVKAAIAEKANYNGATASKEFTISKAAITPAVAVESWTFGEKANEPTVSGNTGNGDVTYTYYQGDKALDKAPTDAGTYTVKATIAETANYKAGEASAEFNIINAEFQVTAKGFAGTYDGKAHGISASTKVEGAKVYFSAEKLDEAGFVKSNQTASPTFKDAGEYTVWYCITTPNYKTVIGSETVKIAQREITITADSLTSEYGADILPLTYKLTGEIVTGDDLGIKLATNADKNTAGKYDITVSYTKNANYAVTVVNGSYTVKDAPETTKTTTTTTSTQATTTTSTQLTTTTTQETTTTTTEPETTTTQATTTTTTEATTATTQATTTSTTAPTTTEPPTTTKAKIKIVSSTSKEVPEGWYASLGGFEEMAWRDFEDKHPGDERVFYADVKQIDENTVECSIYEWMGDHKPLDVYTIDVRTGVGTDQAGEEINLPQTGVTTKNPIVAVGGAIAATLTGLWLTIKASRRKKDEE